MEKSLRNLMLKKDLNTAENDLNFWLVFNGDQLLLTNEMTIPTATHSFIKNYDFKRQFRMNDSHFYIAELTKDEVLPTDLQWITIRDLYHLLPEQEMAWIIKARQINEWNKSHRFCGECGSLTNAATHEYSRICTNESCKRVFFPRITPVIIVAVERGNEILLARSPHFPPQIYSALAGFVEPGESVEACIHREVFEETGIKIHNLRYFASQPWPFPSSLILGFQAEYQSGEVICQPGEIEDAAFFHVDSLPKIFPGNVSVSQWLIKDFCKRHA